LFGVRLLDPVGDDADHDVVRHETAARHHVLGLEPDRRAGRDRGPQHVAGGQLRNAEPLDDAGRLRALSRPRRTQEDDPHLAFPRCEVAARPHGKDRGYRRRAPLSLAFLTRPSYWWASRCPWICATVSIVTDT